MRGHVPGLASPHPLGPALPAVYHDDDFAQRFLGALDAVLAPILSTIDNLDAYLDPRLAPDDFLDWLAGWVGISLDEAWEPERRRAIVARAVELFRMRGTAAGLAEQIAIQTGGRVEIVENGATGWSVDPGGELPGSDQPALLVRVTVADPRAIDARRLDALVAASKPAHIPHAIEIIKAGGRRATGGVAGGGVPDELGGDDRAGSGPAAGGEGGGDRAGGDRGGGGEGGGDQGAGTAGE